jgi:hypothetical protein
VELRGSVFQWPADRPWTSRGILFLFGCLLTTAFAPFGMSMLVPVLLLPLLYVYLSVSPRDAGWLSFCFGFGLFLSGTYWIYISVVIFGEAPTWIALILMLGLVLIMSAYFFAAGWLISRFAQGEPWLLLLVAPATWVLIEWLRGWVLTGFPWLQPDRLTRCRMGAADRCLRRVIHDDAQHDGDPCRDHDRWTATRDSARGARASPAERRDSQGVRMDGTIRSADKEHDRAGRDFAG